MRNSRLLVVAKAIAVLLRLIYDSVLPVEYLVAWAHVQCAWKD